ncbi:hypothetical protein BVG16_18445 [Paenibacillus selenitireducens]|uniref:Uncharacterized protein n=1 Tax=Paenibacillus selenitireducens TaxID=1324314 RepID=A0A1T2X8H5_9BACL|nr:hypothetical protein [Paenibacillus selenitireducens]OPA76188.1 hypothetical protein BVG16_18445 [Paenibacillus selenitireducens]
MKKICFTVIGVLTLAFMLAVPNAAWAGSYTLSVSAQSSLDKTIAAADKAQADRIKDFYRTLLANLSQEDQWNTQILTLHTKNEEALSQLCKQIQQIGASERTRLELQVTQTKEKYKPLFASYTALNQRIQAVKPLKSKELNALLQIQADSMKAALQMARLDIQTKERALKTFKTKTADTIKRIRGILADIEPIKVQIRAEKTMISSVKKQISMASKNLTDAMKKNDATRTGDALSSLSSIIREITVHQQKTYTLEQKIANVLTKAKSQFSAT